MHLKITAQTSRIRFENPGAVFADSKAQMEIIKSIAVNNGFTVSPNFENYERLNDFIAEVKKQIDEITGDIVALSLASGAKYWHEVLSDINTFSLIVRQCKEQLGNVNYSAKQTADIVFRELTRLNGRDETWVKHDKTGNTCITFRGLFGRIRHWYATTLREEKIVLANCRPLSTLFYLTMTALGEKVRLRMTDGHPEGHVYTEIPSSSKSISIENTNKYADRYNLVDADLYNDIIIDIQSIVAQEFIQTFRNQKGEKTTAAIEQEVRVLEQFRSSNAQHLAVLCELEDKYQTLMYDYYTNKMNSDLIPVVLKRESVELHRLKLYESILTSVLSENLRKEINNEKALLESNDVNANKLHLTESFYPNIFNEDFKKSTLQEKEKYISSLLEKRGIIRPF